MVSLGVTSPASLPLGARFCSSRGALVCAAVSAAEAAQGKAPLQPESTVAIETVQVTAAAYYTYLSTVLLPFPRRRENGTQD